MQQGASKLVSNRSLHLICIENNCLIFCLLVTHQPSHILERNNTENQGNHVIGGFFSYVYWYGYMQIKLKQIFLFLFAPHCLV